VIENRTPCSLIARRDRFYCFRPVSGLTSGGYPDRRLPMHAQWQWFCLDSFTVAGAVPGLMLNWLRSHRLPVSPVMIDGHSGHLETRNNL